MRKRVRFLALTVALTVAAALCTSPVAVYASEPDPFLLEEAPLLTQDAEPAAPEEPEDEEAESEEPEDEAEPEDAAEAETPSAPESGSAPDAEPVPDADETPEDVGSAEPEAPTPEPPSSTPESSGDTTGEESQTPAETYSVEVTWGTSTLTYTAGKWDTDSLCYGSGTWSGNASVTVTNNSTAAVDVSCAFTSSLSGVTGSFGTDIGQLASNSSGTATLTLNGTPTSAWPADNIVGTASVSIAAVSSGEENSQ